jgi:MOSC domain-containing protein YiiM
MDQARLLSLQVGLPQEVADLHAPKAPSRTWITGMFKSPVTGPVWVGRLHLEGDGQADLRNHGGPDKAVNAYPSERYPHWRRALGLEAMPFGAFGENFTTQGLLETTVCIGDTFAVGDAVVQVSQPRQPCWKLSYRWRVDDLARQVVATGFTGWYFRVLKEGYLRAGMAITLVERPCPEWPVSVANTIMHHRKQDLGAARDLASCRFLSQTWRRTLGIRAGLIHQTGKEAV